jgi:FMN-dependent NADH-azoreductase
MLAKNLLHIDASPRGERSRSGRIGLHILADLRKRKPELQIETLNLFEADLPDFNHAAVEGRYGLLMGQEVPPDQAAAWTALRRIAAHFLSFDGWLFTVPMWNFGLPYRLKHYIDLVTHPGMTFRNDAVGNVEGLCAGRTAIIVAASAMPITSDGPYAHLDFQLSYLKTWLGFVGVTDIHAMRVAPTFGAEADVEQVMQVALKDASVLVANL